MEVNSQVDLIIIHSKIWENIEIINQVDIGRKPNVK